MLGLLTLFAGCGASTGALFQQSKDLGCITVKQVEVGRRVLGNFVICTEKEFNERVK